MRATKNWRVGMIVTSFQDIMFRDKKTTEKFACSETECPVEAAKDLGLRSDSSFNYDDHIQKNYILKLYAYL